jgi:hypothetical protein
LLPQVTVTGLFWDTDRAGDIHLLPGLASPRLDHMLYVSDTRDVDGARRADSPHPGVTIRFRAQINAVPVLGEQKLLGVIMNVATGEVTVGAGPLPIPRLRSFLVTATASEGAADVASTRIRVYVHERIERTWLTPARLTVRKDATGPRLSLLARFEDSVIGDITNWSPLVVREAADRTFVRWSSATIPLLTWSSSGQADIGVDPRTGEMSPLVAGAAQSISVDPPAPVSIPARVQVGPSWSTAVPVRRVVLLP